MALLAASFFCSADAAATGLSGLFGSSGIAGGIPELGNGDTGDCADSSLGVFDGSASVDPLIPASLLGGGDRVRLDADFSVSEFTGLLVLSLSESPSRPSPTLALNFPKRLRLSGSADEGSLLLPLLLTSASRLRGWFAGSFMNCWRSDGELRLA